LLKSPLKRQYKDTLVYFKWKSFSQNGLWIFLRGSGCPILLTEFPSDEPPDVGGTILDPAGGLATSIHTRRGKLISRKI